MPEMTMVQALNSAMDVLLARDPDVVIFGEDVGFYGGVFRVTEGLQQKHGETRVFDTPIAEGGMMAVAVGMGAYGLRPIVEIQFADYIYPATDQLVSEAARLRYRSGGEFWAPITVRAPSGGGIFGGQTHSQSVEAIFTHVCGLKTVIPSNPYDAKGLLDQRRRGRRPRCLFRAEAALSRPVLRPSRSAGGAVGRSQTGRSARGLLYGAARQGRGRARRRGDDGAGLWHDGACRAGRCRGIRHRRRNHRSAHAVAARHRYDRRFGQEDRKMRHRARGDPHLRFRRRIVGAGAGELLLSSRSACSCA